MNCQIRVNGEICSKEAKIKHHISYFPEITVGTCVEHHNKIHSGDYPELTEKYIQYKKGDSKKFYSQNDRIADFLQRIYRRR